jgi:hypothetical protein
LSLQVLLASVGGGSSSAAAFDPTTSAVFFDDFQACWYSGGTGQLSSQYIWKTLQTGSPAFTGAGTTITSSNTNSGVLQITSTASGDIGSITPGVFSGAGVSDFATGNGSLTFDALIYLNTLSDGSNNNQINVGLSTSPAGSAASNQIIFYYEIGTSTTWNVITTAASSSTTTNTGVAVATGWTHVKFVVDATAANVYAYINATLVATIATNIPSAVLPPMISFRKTLGATARIFGIDYVNITKTFATPR